MSIITIILSITALGFNFAAYGCIVGAVLATDYCASIPSVKKQVGFGVLAVVCFAVSLFAFSAVL